MTDQLNSVSERIVDVGMIDSARSAFYQHVYAGIAKPCEQSSIIVAEKSGVSFFGRPKIRVDSQV